jgi:predicted membrane chloride channel (bestrophin family)
MTSEEMERAIEFLLQSAAKASQQIESLGRTHAEFTQFVRSNLEAQSKLNAAQSEMNQSLRETVRALTVAQARTDERLGDLESGTGQG